MAAGISRAVATERAPKEPAKASVRAAVNSDLLIGVSKKCWQ